VDVLIVVDGLDFSETGFGLATFVRTLLDVAFPVRYRITLASLRRPTAEQMMDVEPRIVRRITSFAFDNPIHFTADLYDVVFIFGIASTLLTRADGAQDADGQNYPTDRLAPSELRAIAKFEQSGGGLFATGDHGALGRYMGRSLPRARNMRLWDSTSASEDRDQVSMGGRWRNDTNRRGDAGSQFDDQSDDIPQPIDPRIYTVQTGLFRYSFPHPLLCGRNGVIRVMPDHPHEGECIEPPNPDLTLAEFGLPAQEYPPALSGAARPLPEVISVNSVLSGTISTSFGEDKAATVPHSFGGICAYDGHRAGVGRVVTDATWHHFVNINLIGDANSTTAAKRLGFLGSPAGQAVLDQVKDYYRNLALWLARRSNHDCINGKLLVAALHHDRVLEAVLTTRDVPIDKVGPGTLRLIGRHARDVLGRYASRCESRRLILDLVIPEYLELVPEIDPWRPRLAEESENVEEEYAADGVGPVTWVDGDQFLDFSLGGALLVISENIGDLDGQDEAPSEDLVAELARKGGGLGLERAFASLDEGIASAVRLNRRRKS